MPYATRQQPLLAISTRMGFRKTQQIWNCNNRYGTRNQYRCDRCSYSVDTGLQVCCGRVQHCGSSSRSRIGLFKPILSNKSSICIKTTEKIDQVPHSTKVSAQLERGVCGILTVDVEVSSKPDLRGRSDWSTRPQVETSSSKSPQNISGA